MLDLAQTTNRRIVDVTAEEIERELEGYFLQNALPDLTTDATISKIVRAINKLGIRNAKYARDGMRPASLDHARELYKDATRAQAEELATALKEPIRIEIWPDTPIVLADGRHRMSAAAEAGAKNISAEIVTYDKRGDVVRREFSAVSIAAAPAPRVVPPIVAQAFRAEFPGSVQAVSNRVFERFPQIEHTFQAIARAVDANSYAKLARVPGIDASKIINGGANALARYRETNARLFRSIPEKMAADVGDALASRPIARLHVREAKNVLAEQFNISANQAEFWARDQTLKLYADVNEDRHAAAGVKEYEWGTSDDERVRGRPGGLWARSPSNHFVLNHTIHRWDTPPIVDPSSGRRCHPGKDYECRCTAYPHFSE